MDKELVIGKILRRLKSIFGDIYDDFIDMMKNDNIVISGSFILQCIYNESWENSDIDIFIYNNGLLNCCGITHNIEPYHTLVELTEFKYENDDIKFSCLYNKYNLLVRNYNNALRVFDSKFEIKHNTSVNILPLYENEDIIIFHKYSQKIRNTKLLTGIVSDKPILLYECCEPITTTYSEHSYISPIESILSIKFSQYTYISGKYENSNILLVRNYCGRNDSKIRIQIIQTTINPCEFINKNFDFPIIKNAFYFLDNKPCLDICNEEDIMSRSTTFFSSSYLMKSILRMYKYHNYYNINFKFPFNDKINNMFKNMLKLSIDEFKEFCNLSHIKEDIVEIKQYKKLHPNYTQEDIKQINNDKLTLSSLYRQLCDVTEFSQQRVIKKPTKILLSQDELNEYYRLQENYIMYEAPLKEQILSEKFKEKYVKNRPEIHNLYLPSEDIYINNEFLPISGGYNFITDNNLHKYKIDIDNTSIKTFNNINSAK